MQFTKPLPNEFCKGHLGRVLAVNNADNFTNFLQMRKPSHPEEIGYRWTDRVSHTVLAHLSGMSAQDYRQQHSLCPIIAMFSGLTDAHARSDEKSGVYSLMFFNPQSPSARTPIKLCPDCRSEDIETHDLAYWHREHQIAGLDVCPRHGTALMSFPPEAPGIWPNPINAMGELADPLLIQANKHPAVVRYQIAALSLLQAQRTRTVKEIESSLTLLAKHKGLRADIHGQIIGLPEYLEKLLPTAWSIAHLACKDLQTQPVYGRSLHPIVENQSYPKALTFFPYIWAIKGQFILLALAGLCDTVDEVISTLFDQAVQTPRRAISEQLDTSLSWS